MAIPIFSALYALTPQRAMMMMDSTLHLRREQALPPRPGLIDPNLPEDPH